MRKTRKIKFRDVTLREGAQVQDGAMSPRDQITYVDLLIKGGIDYIEIGFPRSDPDQLAQCKRIVQHVKLLDRPKKPLLSGLARGVKSDIDVVKEAGCDVCHIFIPASDELALAQFNAGKYGDSEEEKREWIIKQAQKMVKYAKRLGFKEIEYSPEDAARTSRKYLTRIVEAVIDAGATVVNIPDTTGLRIMNEFGDLIDNLFNKVSNIDKAEISVHCHNDSDHSTSNALQAILAGVSQVEGTFYGLGERSGMTKFESIIMNVLTRRDIFENIEIGFNPALCCEIVGFLGVALGMSVPRHWVVVGSQNSICSSGTHQAIEARAAQQGKGSAYYSWYPRLYGHHGVENVVYQSSGSEGLGDKLRQLGYSISGEHLDSVLKKAKKLSNSRVGGTIGDRELTALVQDEIAEIPFPIIIEQCQAIGGKGTIPTANVKARVNGDEVITTATGNGTFNAVMNVVKEAVIHFYPEVKDLDIKLDDWRPVPVTSGSEALADTYARILVQIDGEERKFSGRAVDIDTIQASAQAFANCFSWLIAYLQERK